MSPLHTTPYLTRERGSALLWAVGVLSATVALVFSDGSLTRSAISERSADFARNSQAEAVAQAGLNDALAWLRRQTTQPVLTFAPQRDLAAVPPVNETDDPTLGLVREYEISPGFWGRYEVRKGRPADPFVDADHNGAHDPGETFTDLLRTGPPPASTGFVAGSAGDGYSDGKWTPALWTQDISARRGAASNGTVWYLESHGMVFHRERADLPLGRAPNPLLGSWTSSTEVTRLVMTTPATAAICVPTPGSLTMQSRVRVRATGGLAVATGAATGAITSTGGAQVVASTTNATIPGYDASVQRVFGADWPELKTMADVSSQHGAGGSSEFQMGTLTVLDGNATYGSDLPLTGSGVVAIKGNLTIGSDSKSYFSGVIYVQGNVTIDAPVLIRGTLVATGTVLLRGTSGDYVEVESDPVAVARILGAMSQYRYAHAVFSPDRTAVEPVAASAYNPWSAPPQGSVRYEPPATYGDDDEDLTRVPSAP